MITINNFKIYLLGIALIFGIAVIPFFDSNQIFNLEEKNRITFNPVFSSSNLSVQSKTCIKESEQYYEVPWSLPLKECTERDIDDSSNDNIFFHEDVFNTSVLIVKVSSPYAIFIDDFQYSVKFGVIGEQNSGKADFHYGFITNGTEVVNLGGLLTGELYNINQKDIRYLHIDIGSINYTLDNRPKNPVSGWGRSGWMNCPWNYSFPAGTWYFVFTGGMFDVEEKVLKRNISVWMNFSDQCRDLNISNYTGGQVYAVGYDEFDANLIASKRAYRESHDDLDKKGFEVMINGTATFHSNHSFLYFLSLDYIQAGFVKADWDTPMGVFNYALSNGFQGVTGPDELSEPCFLNIGEPGDYHLKLDYLNWKPFFSGFGKTWPVYLIALDIELP